MRILLIDIDSLRADRLGCYGYHRNTSPTIDQLAANGVRLENCYVSDAPCCPSRSSLFSAQYGIQHGCVNHRGERAERWPNPDRRFIDSRDQVTWPAVLRQNGHRCAFISSFPTRHSAWHSLAGFHDWIDTGKSGHELAPTVCNHAVEWLGQHGKENDWFCHVTFWDAHTPYRTPAEYGEPFAQDEPPAWPDQKALERHIREPGLRSAMDTGWAKGFGPRQPHPINSMEALRGFQDGYDTAVRYIDDHVAKLLARLDSLGIRDETAIIVTADHGEDMGELGAYGSHCFCGSAVARVPMVINWPGVKPALLHGLHQHFDLAATTCELLAIERPQCWSAQSFLPAMKQDAAIGRDFAVCSMLAQGIQRAVFWQEEPRAAPTCYLRTWNNAGHPILPESIFRGGEPVAESAPPPTLLERGRQLLDQWTVAQTTLSKNPDPLEQVLAGGTDLTQKLNQTYWDRLHETGRKPYLP